MDLKLRHLEVFQAVYETGSVTAAAKRLHCTQPAVSVALANFEQQIGMRLFERSKGRFASTPEADALYLEVERGLLGFARIETKARELRAGSVQHLRIGVDGSPAIPFLPTTVAGFLDDHPDVSIDIQSRPSKDVVDWIGSRLLDLGLVETPLDAPGVQYEAFTQVCYALLPAGHPLAGEPVLTPEVLDGVPVVGCFERHPIDTQLEAAFADAGARLNCVVRGFYFATSRNLARCGAGVAFVDALNTDVGVDDGLVAIPFEPVIHYEQALVYPAQPGPGELVSELLDRLRETLEPYVL
ncbi:MAG: LysR substrate-binding domain-containing protein [Acidimicrobiia bacterium]|nr:LysR substrate-binding domain-containing protein [Acidimicrobiia bacterium]